MLARVRGAGQPGTVPASCAAGPRHLPGAGGLGDFDLAFAYEALARGHALNGDPARAREFTEQALAAAEDIAEDDDRDLPRSDLETILGQARFW